MTTRCDAIKSDITFESSAILNQCVLIWWRIRKIVRSVRPRGLDANHFFYYYFVKSIYYHNLKSLALCLPIFVLFSKFLVP